MHRSSCYTCKHLIVKPLELTKSRFHPQYKVHVRCFYNGTLALNVTNRWLSIKRICYEAKE